MASILSSILKRQDCSNDPSAFNYCSNGADNYNGGSNDGDSWWWSGTGMAVRYAVVIVLLLALVAFFIGGYTHARRRMRRGLPPLAYHRWMVQRRSARYTAQNQQYPLNQPYGQQTRYAHYAEPGQPGFPQPPPAYTGWVAPPVYQPPEGASKVMADQGRMDLQRAGESSGGGQVAPPPPAAYQ